MRFNFFHDGRVIPAQKTTHTADALHWLSCSDRYSLNCVPVFFTGFTLCFAVMWDGGQLGKTQTLFCFPRSAVKNAMFTSVLS